MRGGQEAPEGLQGRRSSQARSDACSVLLLMYYAPGTGQSIVSSSLLDPHEPVPQFRDEEAEARSVRDCQRV